MKILIISQNYEHANDSELNLIHGLMEVAEIDFYGPGYSTVEELEKGLRNYWIKGKYDALILCFALATSQIQHLNLRFEYNQYRYLMCDYSIFESIRYANKIIEEAKDIDAPKLVHYHFDTINITEPLKQCLQELLDAGFYLWALGEEFAPEVEQNENTKRTGWGEDNRYFKFCKKNTNKIISMNCHVATYSEFYATPLEKRKYDITIPGNLDANYYPDREKIVNRFKETKYNMYNDYRNRVLAYKDDDRRIENTLYKRDEDRIIDTKLKFPCSYLNITTKREAIAYWRESYNVGLRSSKMAYADGGVALQIVRKYLEIPARGTLLLCQDIPPLSCFGFKPWENMVLVTPDSVLEVCDYLYENPDKMQAIATEGRKMIFNKHSPSIYAKHIIDAINVIKKGRFKGSYWLDGEFYIN